ncbi:hypothetical protein GCM10010211_33800 [Streptomyces albospinus]|uniref:PatG C-terminal domain-containing protein n=1 Tax=Streptomyces albospinus TaxID=285515 RepID=A0ABQ2V2D2_9ACTN|nr:hypothetical protein GCM10010211_33800 [Streptomyces albospinus]
MPVVESEQTTGMYGWRLDTLLDAAPTADVRAAIQEFLTRVYDDLRNPGSAAKDRALDFAATDVFQAAITATEAIATGKALDTIIVEKSPFSRMNSDCWDVKLRFFDPEDGLRPRSVFRFTIDVSDTMPVTLRDIRTWSEAR